MKQTIEEESFLLTILFYFNKAIINFRMKCFGNIFSSSKPAFKLLVVLVVVVLSLLFMIVAVLFSYTFAFVSASSFPDIGLRLNQQLENTVTTATRHLGVSQNSIFSDRNPSDTQGNGNGSGSMISPNSFNFSDLGIEAKNMNNWIMVNHDIYGTRNSNQTIINKENVATLQVKWRLINDVEIQDPPIVIGNKGYVQDDAGTIIAFNADTGEVLWKLKAGNGPTMGLTFNNDTIYAATRFNATVVAINAIDGRIVWQSQPLGDSNVGYNIPTFPILWKDYIIVGSADHSDPSNGVGTVRGNITALNSTNGKIIWNLRTTTGEWVNPNTAPAYNSGANNWSGGSLDPETGIVYMPLGNPSPNFNATTRQQTPNLYANHMIAVNITSGQIIWATPFIDYGTVLNVRVPDTHDWDTSWGSSISKVTFDNGTRAKVVIGHDKMGNVIAMDAATGKEIWWKTLGKQYNTNSIPLPNGSGMVWFYGVYNYHAVDNNDNTLYITATNRGVNYFTDGIAGHKIAAPHTIENGLHNGTIIAMDLRTGKIKWQYQTDFPPRVSPLVTNDIVFAGYIPFTEKTKGKATTATPTHTINTKSGVILALNKETGEKLWEYNLNAPIGQVGPSIGDGMLFVPTGKIQGQPKGGGQGSIVAFVLP
jgi:alcohol dehydrogenase (cytochrome c)